MTANKGKRVDLLNADASLTLPSQPKLDRAIQSRIGDQLRAMYTELLEQPVPDRFAELITKLESSAQAKRSREETR